jgi:hypothetical protein
MIMCARDKNKWINLLGYKQKKHGQIARCCRLRVRRFFPVEPWSVGKNPRTDVDDGRQGTTSSTVHTLYNLYTH